MRHRTVLCCDRARHASSPFALLRVFCSADRVGGKIVLPSRRRSQATTGAGRASRGHQESVATQMQLSQDDARALFAAGGFLLLDGLPAGSDVSVDASPVYAVTDRFKVCFQSP